jgi:hypothetical protein
VKPGAKLLIAVSFGLVAGSSFRALADEISEASLQARKYSEAVAACTPGENWLYSPALSEEWQDLLGSQPGKPFDTFAAALALKQQASGASSSSELLSLSEFLMARALFSAKLVHLAHESFTKLVSTEAKASNLGVLVASFECLSRIHEQYPTLTIQGAALERLLQFPIAKLPAKMKASIHEAAFHAAKSRAGAAAGDETLTQLQTLLSSGASSYRHFVNALIAEKNADHATVASELKKVIEDTSRPKAVEARMDLVFLMHGRALYTIGKFTDAAASFVRVPRESNLLAEALSDLSWAQFMAGKVKEASGTAMNLQKTALKRAFAPEAPMIMAMIFNELCRYPQAIRAVQYFRKHHESAYKYLYGWQTAQKEATTEKPAPALYPQLVTFLSNPKKSPLPDLVASEWIRSPVFISHQQEINLISDEKKAIVKSLRPLKREQQILAQKEPSLRKQIAEMSARIAEERRENKGRKISSDLNQELRQLRMQVELYKHRKAAVPLWYQTLASFHKASATRDTRLVADIERDLMFRNNRMIRQLLRVAENTQLVEIEIYDGASEDMVWRNANPEYKDVAKKLKDEQRKPSSASGSYHWGTVSFGKGGEKEEVWEDELGWFQGDMTDECASKDKYLKLRELQQGG